MGHLALAAHIIQQLQISVYLLEIKEQNKHPWNENKGSLYVVNVIRDGR